MKYCMSCGEKNSPVANFCLSCGKSFNLTKKPVSRMEVSKAKIQTEDSEVNEDDEDSLDYCPSIGGLEFEVEAEEIRKVSLDDLLKQNNK